MDTERNLLFGVVAFQNGAVDADRLAETCADWVSQQKKPLADLMVDRGLMTDEQRTEVEKAVSQELANHGGDPQATLAATVDGRSIAAIGEIASAGGVGLLQPDKSGAQNQGGHVVLGTLSPGEPEKNERYTLTHLHAKGGMGRVWLARDGSLGRQIALKELRPDQSDNSIVCSRFLYEAKITAQLEHPGIVPVYEMGEGEAPYYTMRFVRGKTLSEAVRAYHKKRITGEADMVGMVELLSNFASVCHAVAYAHSRGIIHRDLKGQNVVLGDFGEVIVLDWGLAKRIGPDQFLVAAEESAPKDPALAPMAGEPGTAVTCAAGYDDDFTSAEPPHDNLTSAASTPGASSHHNSSAYGSSAHHGSSAYGSGVGVPESGAGPEGTMQGQLLGTPAYMAPEQAQGRHDLVDQRTDIYGLGAILYEILTGRPPFIAPKTSEVIRKVCNEAPTPPRQIVPQITPGLEAVCLKALSKEKSERYTTAAELAQEVRRWLADEPVKAYAEPWTQRAARWIRRHKTAVSAAAALLITATIALGVSTLVVSQERNEAEAQGLQARQAVHLLTKVADIGFDEKLDPLQEEFLKNALDYYEQFTSRVSRDPAVRLEHGRAHQQMGDILRKLGRLPESQKAYQRAIDILQPLAAAPNAAHDTKQSLARTQTLMADLLVRRGTEKDQAEPLYNPALEVQRVLADAKKDPAATTLDILRLGQTLKSQADLLRLNGKFSLAKPVYDEAVAELDRAHNADTKKAEPRNELALTLDARGLIFRDLGNLPDAETDFRRSVELLDKLVSEFPTAPRFRQSLAKVCNSLGTLKQDAGRLTEAEEYFRRELPLVDRLAQDFPDRPEHRRELARTLSNLGNVLSSQGRIADAEPSLRRAVQTFSEIAAKSPDDVLMQFDLAKCQRNLGELLLMKGDAKQAVALFRQSQPITEKLVKAHPDQPRYRSLLAGTLASLGFGLQTVGEPGAEPIYRTALQMYDKLVTDHPENLDYRIGQVRCLRNLGPIVADAGQPDKAEAMYRQALGLLETKDAANQRTEQLRSRAEILINLGELQRKVNKTEAAEDSLRRAMSTFESLTARKPTFRTDTHLLAITQFNLGQHLNNLKRYPESLTLLNQASGHLETLVAELPKSVDFQSHLGLVQHEKGDLLSQTGKLAEAKTAYTNAVAHQRLAVTAGKNRDDLRALLGTHLLALADIDLKLASYKDAATLALELPNSVPAADRGQGCFDAARVLARLVVRISADLKLPETERNQLTRNYLGRTVVLLREAIDASPKLADQIKNDADIKALASRPEFQTIMNTLVDVTR